MLAVLSAALLVLYVSLVNAASKTYHFNVSYIHGSNPDGLHPRRSIGVNGKFHVPIINVNSTDQVNIKVRNKFKTRGTSIHAHGIFFNNTGYYDGAVGLGQCAVPPGEEIVHKVLNAPESPKDAQKQWGTYWAHGHYAGQYVDGYRTPLVIHKADGEAYKYDDDYTIILADWYHREHDDLLHNEFLNAKNPDGDEPVPSAPLVYAARTPRNGDAHYLDGFNNNMSLKFEPGKTYRLRFINMAAIAMFHVWIDGHQMHMIEADGEDMEKLPVKTFSVAAGQRYSVLVTAKNSTSHNYQLHANMDPDMFDDPPKSLQMNVTGTIEYAKGAKVKHGKPPMTKYEPFDDMQLKPIRKEPMYPADIKHDLNVWLTKFSNGRNYAMFNNISYRPPLTPVLYTAATTSHELRNNNKTYGPSTNAMVLPHLKYVQIRVLNWDDGYHPFHLHGTRFQVVHKSKDNVSKVPKKNPPLHEHQKNPVRRDTVSVPPGGSATLRFYTDNPGAWFFHCHIDWHLSAGLALPVVVAPDEIAKNQKIPHYLSRQCRMRGHPASGNAGGRNSTKHFGSLSHSAYPLSTSAP